MTIKSIVQTTTILFSISILVSGGVFSNTIAGIKNRNIYLEENTTSNNLTFLGFKNISITSLAIVEKYIYVGTRGFGIYRKNLDDVNSKWEYKGFFTKTINTIYIDPKNSDTIYVGLEESGRIKLLLNRWNSHSIYKSKNGGSRWIPFDRGIKSRELLFNRRLPTNCINGPHDNSDVIYVTSTSSIFKSIDNAKSWDLIWGQKDGFRVGVHTITIDPSNSNIIWAGGEKGLFFPFLLKSDNAGKNWNDIAIPTSGDNAVYNIAIRPEDSNTIYVGMEGQLVKSIDGGDNWTILLEPEDYPYFRAIVIDPLNPDHIFTGSGPSAGCDNPRDSPLEIWESYDGGEKWICHNVSTKEGGRRVLSLVIDSRSNENTLYIGTSYGGLWSYEFKII